MHFNQLVLLALVGLGVSAQSMLNLTSILSGNSQLSNLTTYVNFFPQLVNTLSNARNVTILAPNDMAFSSFINSTYGSSIANNDTGLIEAILMYHVLNGSYNASQFMQTPSFIPTMLVNTTYENVTGGQVVETIKSGNNSTFYSGLLQNASISQPNIEFSGGYIHVIDHVLIPPQNVSTTAIAANLTAVVGALNYTNITSIIDTARDVTIFAPMNRAFQSIGSALSNLSSSELSRILEYHVVQGNGPNSVGYSTRLSNNTSLRTLSNNNITITINNGSIYVNSARVIVPDILVAGGVLHIIDNVLNPNATAERPNTSASASETPAYSGASSGSAVPFTSGVSTPTSVIPEATATSATRIVGTQATGTATSTSKKAAAAAMQTGGVGAAALFGAGVVGLINL
ncbi:MAG: hypothetical protein M1834_006241 [Cirrosporium novae-zelandiae]|nr:MAG: hypothetical protein M1834_006241 [Cirrosporium novae-zelandiae]